MPQKIPWAACDYVSLSPAEVVAELTAGCPVMYLSTEAHVLGELAEEFGNEPISADDLNAFLNGGDSDRMVALLQRKHGYTVRMRLGTGSYPIHIEADDRLVVRRHGLSAPASGSSARA